MNKIIFGIVLVILSGCSNDYSEFEDQKLQGKLSGSIWVASHVSRQIYDFGNKKEEVASIYAEKCKGYDCLSIKSPSINLKRLSLNQGGGNFSMTNNITIYTPPNINFTVTNGIYNISNENGKMKLELKFWIDEENYLNGYIFF